MYTTANGNPCEAEPNTPVDHSKLPSWLRQRLLKTFGPTPYQAYINGPALLWYWLKQHCPSHSWLDHWGTAFVNGEEALVSEPYYTMDCDFSELERFAEMLDCDFIADEKSYWFPGKTIRLALVPKA
jgi:hypothetical protein